MFKKSFALAAILQSLVPAAFAAEYFLVIPVTTSSSDPAKPTIVVELAGATLPVGKVGVPYAGFDFHDVLTVTGDPAYTGTGVSWRSGDQVPPGLTFGDGKLLGTPTAATAPDGSLLEVTATYKAQANTAAYSVIVEPKDCLAAPETFGKGIQTKNVTVPEGCTTMQVQAWGAAGTHSYRTQTPSVYGWDGYGGSYAYGMFRVQEGAQYKVYKANVSSAGSWKSGGISASRCVQYLFSGAGGGATALVDMNDTPLIVAGGGGGGTLTPSGPVIAPATGQPHVVIPNTGAGTPGIGGPGICTTTAAPGGGGGGYPYGGVAGTETAHASNGLSYVAPSALNSDIIVATSYLPGNPTISSTGYPYGQAKESATAPLAQDGGMIITWSR